MRKAVHRENHLADPLPNWTPTSGGNQLPSRATLQQSQQDSSADAESIDSGDVIHGTMPRPWENNERLLTID
jgi:hypothetical protein